MQIKKAVLAIISTVLISASVSYAVIQTFKDTNHQVVVSSVYDLIVVRSDTLEECYVVPWGTLNPGEQRSINDANALGADLQIKNAGNNPLYIAWTTSGTLSAYITLTVRYEMTTGNFVDWAENDYAMFPAIQSGAYSNRIWMQIFVDTAAPSGTSSWTVTFNGADTSAG